MQKEQMKKLLFSFLPEIHEKNLIHEFPVGEDSMAIGISLENIDEERNIFVYNIFCGDEYININGYGTQKEPLPDVMLEEITTIWKKCNTQWNRFYMSVVEFRGDTETDYATTLRLRISFLGQIALIISNVSFENKRHGTMSKVLEFFIQKCKENNVPKIIIQCVLSEEMASFCLKHGFVPNTNTCIMKNGTILKEYLSGDYELFLE